MAPLPGFAYYLARVPEIRLREAIRSGRLNPFPRRKFGFSGGSSLLAGNSFKREPLNVGDPKGAGEYEIPFCNPFSQCVPP